MKIRRKITALFLAVALALVNVSTTFAATTPKVVNVDSSNANGYYRAGQSISIQVVFDQAVIVDTTGGTPRLELNSGGAAYANYINGSGSATLNFTYTIASGENSGQLDYSATDSLDAHGGTIKDTTGLYDALLALPPPGSAGSLAANATIRIDTIAPTIPIAPGVTSTSPDGYYKAGQSISIQVTFSEIMLVNQAGGTPKLTLNSGGTAYYDSGSATNILTFTYSVTAGNNSSDLDYSSNSSLSQNGGAITDQAGNPATLTLPEPNAAGSLGANANIIIDTTNPTSSITFPINNGYYNGTTWSTIIGSSSDAGSGVNKVDTSIKDTTAGNWWNGTSFNNSSETWLTATGTTSWAYSSLASTNLTNGHNYLVRSRATDNAGNAETPGTGNSFTYDTTAPTAAITYSVAGPYKSGSAVTITATFSEAMAVSPVPQIAITGANTLLKTDMVRSSSTVYTYPYMVGAGNGTATIAMNTGTDLTGNGVITAPTSGSTFTVDNIAPTVTINQAAGQADPTNASPINFTVVFSEVVTGLSSTGVTLGGTAGATTATVTGGPTTYNVAVTGMTTSGTVTATIKAGAAQDAAGNLNLASTSTDNTVTFDSTALTVTINQAVGQMDPTKTSPINFTVLFSKVVTDFATGDVALSGTAVTQGITIGTVLGSGTTYSVAVSGMTANGTVIANILPGVAHDAAFNANLASSSTDNTVTYDTIAPVFTAVTPAPSTFISSITGTTSAVSYTLSETVASGSISMTRTGGTADPGSPHACTLKGTALNSGSHNKLDLSDTTNACTTAQSLVSGAVYTFAFNAADLAGNSAVPVTNTNVTFDNTGPIFSAVAPATSAFIRSITGTTSAVSYNLSKTITSGSITMTWSGGTGDPGSPHLCTLTGTALSSGAHNNLDLSNTTNSCTVAQSLISGAVYTFAFNGIDAAGNVAPTVTSTNVTFDSTFPTISWIFPVGTPANPYFVGNQSIQLAVNATDNVGVTQVVFSRWDYKNNVRVTIGSLTSPTTPPSTYIISLDTSTLLPNYNEIDVKAYDATNNGIQEPTFLYHLPVVTVTKQGPGTGTVTSSPPGINCGLTCSYGFADKTVVMLTASPVLPSTFAGWGGACSGTGTCTLTMDALEMGKSVTATFTGRTYLPLIMR